MFKSSNLWVSPYSQYQQELFSIIRSQHEEQSMNFVEICDYLVSNGYKSQNINVNMFGLRLNGKL